MEIYADISGFLFITSESTIEQDKCTYIVGVYDGISLKIYINSILDTQIPVSPGGNLSSTLGLGIGNQTERNRPFNGIIDNVALYNRALDENEIKGHYLTVEN